MKFLYQDSSGKGCAAKVAFMLSLCTMLYLAVTIEQTLLTEFLTGAAAFLASVGAVYWGRNKSKGDADAG